MGSRRQEAEQPELLDPLERKGLDVLP